MTFAKLPLARPILVLALLIGASIGVSPVIRSAGEAVESLEIRRDPPGSLWKWGRSLPLTLEAPGCEPERIPLESAITKWPKRVLKLADYQLSGRVGEHEVRGKGVGGVRVDVFLNESKDAPGVLLGTAVTSADGSFFLAGRFPDDMDAARYHLVAHAHELQEGCRTYLEHWSDPEMDVLAKTRISLAVPKMSIVGEETLIRGWLLDVGGVPVRDEMVQVRIGKERLEVQTDNEGRFEVPFVPERDGTLQVAAEFDGTRYHGRSSVAANVSAASRAVVLKDVQEPIPVVRGEETRLQARVVGLPTNEVNVTFGNVSVTACPECPLVDSLRLVQKNDENLTLSFMVPASEPAGPFEITVGALGAPPLTYEALLLTPVTLTLQVEEASMMTREFRVGVRALDDHGEPVPGTVQVDTPEGPAQVRLDASGRGELSGTLACGRHELRAAYPQDETHAAAQAVAPVAVCPWGRGLPNALVDNLWMLPVGLLAVAGAWMARRRHLLAHAPDLSWGSPLELHLAHPDDAAADVLGVGEPARLLAKLPEGLPEQHRLLVGTPHALVPAAGLAGREAFFSLQSDSPGRIVARAEVRDEKDRPVSRRSLRLRVVRYGPEIERRFARLKDKLFGAGSIAATPWDVARRIEALAPAGSRAAARLVALYEEAEYSPRRMGRPHLAEYARLEEAVHAVLDATREAESRRDPRRRVSRRRRFRARKGAGA